MERFPNSDVAIALLNALLVTTNTEYESHSTTREHIIGLTLDMVPSFTSPSFMSHEMDVFLRNAAYLGRHACVKLILDRVLASDHARIDVIAEASHQGNEALVRMMIEHLLYESLGMET